MIKIPLETENRGLLVDDLVDFAIKATGDTVQNALAHIASWHKQNLIIVRKVRGTDGQISFFVWRRDPKIVSHEKLCARLVRLTELGGIPR